MKQSQNITKSTLWTIVSQIPAHLFGIIAGVFITRILGPEGRGVYSIYFTNTVFFATVFGFSITNSIIFFTANKKISTDRLKSIVMILLAATLALTGVTLLVWLNLKPDIKDLFLPDYNITWILIIYFITIVLLSQINVIFTAYFQGLRHFRIVNLVLILNGIYGCVVFFISYMLHTNGYYLFHFEDIVGLLVAILLLNTFHWLVYYFRHEKIRFKFQIDWKKDFQPFLKFTSLNHLSSILDFFNQKMIVWFIVFYLDNWKLGIFSLGMGLAQLLYLFSTPLNLILESFLSADKTENQGQLFSIFSRIQFTSILIICLVVSLVSPIIVPWVYGKDFSSSVIILNIIMLGVILSCQSRIITSYFLANNRLRHNVISSTIGIVITLIFTPILIEKYQLIGAACSQIVTFLSIFIYLLIAVRVKEKVDTNLFFVTKSDILFIKKQLNSVK